MLISKAKEEHSKKIKSLKEDVERTGGVYGSAELAALEGTGVTLF